MFCVQVRADQSNRADLLQGWSVEGVKCWAGEGVSRWSVAGVKWCRKCCWSGEGVKCWAGDVLNGWSGAGLKWWAGEVVSRWSVAGVKRCRSGERVKWCRVEGVQGWREGCRCRSGATWYIEEVQEKLDGHGHGIRVQRQGVDAVL